MAARAALLSSLAASLSAAFTTAVAQPAALASSAQLEQARRHGDLVAQRRHLWAVLASVTQPEPQSPRSNRPLQPAFTHWFSKAEVFDDRPPRTPVPRTPFPGIPNSARSMAPDLLGTPVLTFTHFNPQATAHIRRLGLFTASRLEALREAAMEQRRQSRAGAGGSGRESRPSIPEFPRSATIVMTAWWPVAGRGITAVPVWDSPLPGRRPGSQPYTRWPRVVAVDPVPGPGTRTVRTTASDPVAVEFAGRRFAAARRVGLELFFHLPVDGPTASRLMADPLSRKAVLVALGRPLRDGDWLVLVGMHLMTRELPGGVWGTFWWHDRPDDGPSAAGRPAALPREWRHYLMEGAFDAVLPRQPDGSPRVAFNPWFEAPFPAGPQGDGQQSNCVNCHARAAFPAVPFLPVRRGAPDLVGDPAHGAERLTTEGVWSVARSD